MSMIIDGTNGLTFNNATTQNSAGSVLQVVSTNYPTYTSTASATYADTGITATITPKFATSKILVTATIAGAGKSGSTTLLLKILRGSTTVLLWEGAGFQSAATSCTGGEAITYLDAPATTSATTYKVQFANQAASGTTFINNYITSNGDSNCSITLMEISGT